ncbi:MAG: glycosyltransferase family 4 protein [Proteobacteria bacterium]|nr:MAG: glycosyltransferase family 4 protein [Pseudomonadota bacterium]
MTDRRRLLILSSTYPRWEGDPEPGFVHELAKRLTGEFDVHVLCPHAARARAGERLDGVTVHRYRYAPARFESLVHDGGIVANLRRAPWKWILVPSFLLGQMIGLRRLCRRLEPHVLHAHWIVPQCLVVAALKSIGMISTPTLATIHGADLFGLQGRWFVALKRWALLNTDRTTVVSTAMIKPTCDLGVSRRLIDVAPMGVDFENRFKPSSTVRRSENELLFVGRLVEKKGLRVLISALPRILEQRPDTRVTIAGYGPEENRLRVIAQSLGVADRIDFLGAVSQEKLPDLYRRAALFVAPFLQARDGDQEGLGLVVVEAIACGCPVIAGNIPAVRDVLDATRCQSLLVSPGDPVALADRIIQFLSSGNSARISIELREQIASRFGWLQVARNYSRILTSIMRASPEAYEPSRDATERPGD